MNRHELTVRGVLQQKPTGDFTWTNVASVKFPADGEKKGTIRIQLVGKAPGSAPLIKGAPADYQVTQKIVVEELKGKHGDFDLKVVDGAEKVLFEGTVKT
jgi:hypothetical protein